jgi:pheromone shutdown protein TraB
MVSGLVQAAICKPRVSDVENMAADGASLKGLYRNRITRVLLVFFLSSLGSSIATPIAGSALIASIINMFKGN